MKRWIMFLLAGLAVSVVFATDSDADGMDDAWEIQYFGNLSQTANGDYDNDGRTNAEEEADGTDPTDAGSTLGLVAYYPFDGNADDATTNGNGGTVYGAILTNDCNGQASSAYNFDGVNDYISTPINMNTDHLPTLSISIWFYGDETSSGSLVSNDNLDHDRKVAANIGTDTIQISKGSDWDDPTVTISNAGLSVGEWNHVVLVYNWGVGIDVYINNTYYSTGALPISCSGSAAAKIGRNDWNGGTSYYEGAIDEVRFYNRALSSTEVARLYEATAPVEAVSTYQLIEGSFTWHEAKADAEARGGHLACITSSNEWNELISLVPTGTYTRFWIGATDELQEDNWQWVSGESWGIDFWAPDEPNDKDGEDYVEAMFNNPVVGNAWNDNDNAQLTDGYILEIEGGTSQPEDLNPDLSSLSMRVLDSLGTETGNPSAGEEVTFEVTVCNTGETNTSGNVLVQIFEGTVPSDLSSYNSNDYIIVASTVVTESIEAGASTAVLIPWTVTSPSRMTTLTAVAEFESNRTASQSDGVLPVEELSLANNSVGRSVGIGSASTRTSNIIQVVPAVVSSSIQSGMSFSFSGTANYSWDTKEPVLGALATVMLNGETYEDRTSSPDGSWSVVVNGLPVGEYSTTISVDDGHLIGQTNIILSVSGSDPTIDLRVKQIAFESGTYRISGETGYAVTGDGVTLKALVRNDGNTDSGSFSIDFLDSLDSVVSTVTTSLPAFTELWITAPSAWMAQEGTHLLTVTADSGEAVTESSESNNERSCTLIGGVAKPDLIVTDIAWTSGTLKEGDSVTFTATIYNQGGAALLSGSSFETAFSLGGTVSTTLSSDLPSGSSITVQTTWTAVAGSYSISAEADSGSAIDEDYENNNSRTETITVRQALPDLRPYYKPYSWKTVSGLSFSPSQPVAGDAVTLTCDIYNNGTVPLVAGTSFIVVFTKVEITNQYALATNTVSLTADLVPGGKVQTSAIWNSTTDESAFISVSVDVHEQVTEEIESNNATANALTVYPVDADITAASLAFSPNQPLPGAPVALVATIRNNGGTAGGSGETVEFYRIDSYPALKIGESTLSSDIAAKGGTATVSLDWFAPDVTTNIWIQARINDTFAYQELLVSDNPAPNLQLFSEHISVSPALPNYGESVTVMADIRNTEGSVATNFCVRFSYDRYPGVYAVLDTVPVDSLMVGSNVVVESTIAITAENSAYTLKVEILPNQAQGDADEGDNIATSSFLLADTPYADAGSDVTCFVGQTVSFDGTGSANASNYNWTVVSAPVGSSAVLTDADTGSPAFTPDLPGSYEVELVVDSGASFSTPGTVIVTAEWIKWVVESEHGNPVPDIGTNLVSYGMLLTNTVEAAVTNGSVMYVCTGVTIGQAEACTTNGEEQAEACTTNLNVHWFTTNVVDHGSVVWAWSTNWWLEVVTSGEGQVTGGDIWVADGSNVVLTATAADGWRFDHWIITTEDTEAQSNSNAPSESLSTLWLTNSVIDLFMDTSKTATGVFVELTLAECVDNHGLEWTTGGSSNWFGQVEDTYDGQDAVRSGDIGDAEVGWIETIVPCPGTLTFRWKVSSEEWFDWLYFMCDDYVQLMMSGEKEWREVTFRVEGEGSHPVRWVYSKDKSLSSGKDCGWLDEVVWTPDYTGFALWAYCLELGKDVETVFGQDRNDDGIANAFDFAFGTNLTGCLLLSIKMVDGEPKVEIPAQDDKTLPYVDIHVRGSTNLFDWTLPVAPVSGAPVNREWFQPGSSVDKAYFKLEAELK